MKMNKFMKLSVSEAQPTETSSISIARPVKHSVRRIDHCPPMFHHINQNLRSSNEIS